MRKTVLHFCYYVYLNAISMIQIFILKLRLPRVKIILSEPNIGDVLFSFAHISPNKLRSNENKYRILSNSYSSHIFLDLGFSKSSYYLIKKKYQQILVLALKTKLGQFGNKLMGSKLVLLSPFGRNIDYEQHYRIEVAKDLCHTILPELYSSEINYPFLINHQARLPKNNPETIKKVIIFPNANSIEQPSSNFYIELIEYFQNDGFEVFTNIINNESPVVGSKRLEIKLADLYLFAQQGYILVGTRSGVFDYLVSAGTNVIALYNKDYQFIHYNSLEQWKTDSKILEIVYNNFSVVDLYEIIKRHLRIGV
jgi:hypothetical protein